MLGNKACRMQFAYIHQMRHRGSISLRLNVGVPNFIQQRHWSSHHEDDAGNHVDPQQLVTCFSTAKFFSKEDVTKRVTIPKRLLETGTITYRQLVECDTPIPVHVLSRYHCPQYVSKIVNGDMTDGEMRKIGYNTWSNYIATRARIAVQTSLNASVHAMKESTRRRMLNANHNFNCNTASVSVVLAGGSHHAAYDHGSGYCIFNDIICSGEYLKDEGYISRYLVIDLDVHQGDGTAQMASGKDHIFTFSMHGEKNFPLRKQKSSWDVPLPDHTGDVQYNQILHECLNQLRVWRLSGELQFDIIFYQSGVDPFKLDRLGRLSLTVDGLATRDELVAQFARDCQVPIVVSVGGGYPDESKGYTLNDMTDLHVQTVKVMSRVMSAPNTRPEGPAYY